MVFNSFCVFISPSLFFLSCFFVIPLPQVEEVKRRQHCLMFSSAGSQAQTYFVIFDTLTNYQRWYRQASKVSKRKTLKCLMSCSVVLINLT